MKQLILIAHFCLLSLHVYSQKRALTDTSYKNWTSTTYGLISNDGNYVSYVISNMPKLSSTLVVTATDKSWQSKFTNVQDTRFSSDSRYLFGMLGADTLVRLKLGTTERKFVPRCSYYSLHNSNNIEWLISVCGDSSKQAVVENLRNGKQFSISHIEQILSKQGDNMLVLTRSKSDSSSILMLVDLPTGKVQEVYNGGGSGDYIFDHTGNLIAFTIALNDRKALYVFNKQDNQLRELQVDSTILDPSVLTINTATVWRFTSDDKSLMFAMDSIETVGSDAVGKAFIWSYQDSYLAGGYRNFKSFAKLGKNLTIFDLKTGKTRRLLTGNQRVSDFFHNTDVLLVKASHGMSFEVPWNKALYLDYLICHTKTGRLDTIKLMSSYELSEFSFSNDQKYLIYFDPVKYEYRSFNTETRKNSVISKKIPESLSRYEMIWPGKDSIGAAGIAGWITDLNRVIIQGRYHLWSVDPEGVSDPVNLNANCNDSNGMIYNLPSRDFRFSSKQEIIISSFNLTSKKTELYKANFAKKKCIEVFRTDDFLDEVYALPFSTFQKAKYANKYLFHPENVSRSSNYIFTDDFKSYDTLFGNNPESFYNWITSEVIRYKDKSGFDCEAVLYKPQDFDSSKRYPVIMNYYTEQSNWVNKHISPEPIGLLNIPLLVSNGYLVVKPNIYLHQGEPGESALTSVMAARDYISMYTWVDSTKIGILGHSFAGYLTNYIVCGTNKFAAAVSAAGLSNLIDGVTDTWSNGRAKVNYFLKGPFTMRKELNEIPDKYIKNSPIMLTNGISTPLLLIHNEKDKQVPVLQSIQFFIQLRRSGKQVWLLQYEGEGHNFTKEENQIDSERKIMDFFDHFLKGKPAPDWLSAHN
ncbi:S9 family peptidase [Chitinophaga sp. CF418]|uniref:alpha/beta hydrolase family protein n=1 Tax=Chitinophaga sp. CF418 TaxID=1855287 RepID=UPI000920C247|nr:prolyl oligopeptidase family serine peptidase [Chitinophaga sp. CF418]SHM83787.1 Prolyl oligopeptidase family protein [Chitinophaga sp. CF418]